MQTEDSLRPGRDLCSPGGPEASHAGGLLPFDRWSHIWDHMHMAQPSIHLRLPRDLHEEVRKQAEQQGVSLNTLIATLVAGALGWKPYSKRVRPARWCGWPNDPDEQVCEACGYPKEDE